LNDNINNNNITVIKEFWGYGVYRHFQQYFSYILAVHDNEICVTNLIIDDLICLGWHFTLMWKTFPAPHHFSGKVGLGP
jgi:hypothetical protein